MTDEESREVGLPLTIAILVMPLIFAWFLLLPGYTTTARTMAFGYAFFGPLLALNSGLGGVVSF